MKYPEHDKLSSIKDQSQSVGDFIEWLEQHGYYICERRESESSLERIRIDKRQAERYDIADAIVDICDMVADQNCLYWPTTKRLPNKLLAEYFEIDENRLEDEKRMMLHEMRKQIQVKK